MTNTAAKIHETIVEIMYDRFIILRQEIDNMTEAFTIEEYDDMSTHLTQAITELVYIQSLSMAMLFVDCVEDGSWEESK